MLFLTQFAESIDFTITESNIGLIFVLIGLYVFGVALLPSLVVILWRVIRLKLPMYKHSKVVIATYALYMFLAYILWDFGSDSNDADGPNPTVLYTILEPTLIVLALLSGALILAELVIWVVAGMKHLFFNKKESKPIPTPKGQIGMPSPTQPIGDDNMKDDTSGDKEGPEENENIHTS